MKKNVTWLRFQIRAVARWSVVLLLLSACNPVQSNQTTTASTDPSDTDRVQKPPELPGPSLITTGQKQTKLDSFFRALHLKQGFNGAVLVAQQGQVLYRGAFGYADFEKKDTLTTHTVFQLASVSKPFTALAILLLKEKGYISLQDPVQSYLPDFPYPATTIKQLLTHSSGLPDYLSLARHYWSNQLFVLSNQELIGQLSRHKPSLRFKPGSRFAYSNTGYAILAALIESLSGLSYGHFLKTKVFQPLGMNHSGTISLIDTTSHLAQGHTAAGKRVPGDCLDTIFGDKGLYSSVEDLYLWDQALYTEKLLKQTALQDAFEGSVRINHAEAYGYGWRVRQLAGGEQVLYHTGRWHGFRSYLMRNPRDRSTVIILSNVDKSIDPEDFQYILYPPVG